MTNQPWLLILGGSGNIGRYMFRLLDPGAAVVTYCRHPIPRAIRFDAIEMDVSSILDQYPSITHATVLFGLTDPEVCAAKPELSHAVNVESTKKIVDALRARDIFIHFMSSHFIFDGTKGNYTEEDKPTPILLYGKQKVEIERYLQETCDRYVILRLSKAVGDEPRDGTLFPNWIDGIIAGQRTIRCAADQIFSPIFTGDVCRGILAAMENDCRGIYNLSGFRAYSRMQLLELLLSQLEAYTSKPVNVVPCSINDFPLLEKRPLDVSMPPRKLVGATHLQIGSMEDVCLRTVERYFLKGVHQTPDKGAM